MTHFRVGLATLAVLTAAACASSGQRPGGMESRANEDVLTGEELANAAQSDMFSLIQAHRPRWFERRAGLTFNSNQYVEVEVFLDNSPMGTPDVLHSFPVRGAAEVRYYAPDEAEARFGVGYIAGVIQIISRSH